MKVFTTLLAPILLGLAAAFGPIVFELDSTPACGGETSFQTVNIFSFGDCNNASEKFQSLVILDVPQDLIYSGAVVVAFEKPNCQGLQSTSKLVDMNECLLSAGESFKVLQR